MSTVSILLLELITLTLTYFYFASSSLVWSWSYLFTALDLLRYNMPFLPDTTLTDELGAPLAAAAAAAVAAAQSSPLQIRTRKQTAPKDYMERPVKFGKSSRDVLCTLEQFELMLNKSYGPRINNDGMRKSGKDKHGHTLWYDNGLVRCQA